MIHPRIALTVTTVVLLSGAHVRGFHSPIEIGETQEEGARKDVAPDLDAVQGLIAAGRAEEALAVLNKVLQRNPVRRDATVMKIAVVLERQDFSQALSTYDAYTSALKKPDIGALELIAHAQLRRLAAQYKDDPAMAAGALERLARDGDAQALASLRRMAPMSSPTVAYGSAEFLAILSLAKLGDMEAAGKLGSALESATSDKRAEGIRAIQQSGVGGQARRVVSFLDDHQPDVRAAAALALGIDQVTQATPRLRELFHRDDVALVRMFAAVALRLLGDTEVDAYLSSLLTSGVPEVRLIVAQAYARSKGTQWMPPIRELLGDRNELTRVRAAELLACCDKSAAIAALVAALDSPDPLLRGEAARILEATRLADGTIMRQLLGDPVDIVLLHGAGAVSQSR